MEVIRCLWGAGGRPGGGREGSCLQRICSSGLGRRASTAAARGGDRALLQEKMHICGILLARREQPKQREGGLWLPATFQVPREGLSVRSQDALPLLVPPQKASPWLPSFPASRMRQCGAPSCGRERPCSPAARIPGCPPSAQSRCPTDGMAVPSHTPCTPTGLPLTYIPGFFYL